MLGFAFDSGHGRLGLGGATARRQPTRRFRQQPLQQALQYGLITQAVGLCGALACALTIDRVGRR
ncbi:MAG: hypothetical protein WBG12_04100, partial [Xanthobacteraceae bacterium]